MLCREKSLLLELSFQLLKGQLRRADAVREHLVDVDLKRAVPLVKGSTAAHHHPHPFLWAKRHTAGIGAKHHCFYAAGFVPQRKIAVSAAGVLHKVCDLAAQGKIKQTVVDVQKRFDIMVQL